MATRRRRLEGRSILQWLFLGVFFGTSIAEGVCSGALMPADGALTSALAWVDLVYRLISMPVLLGTLLTLSDAPMSRPQRMRPAFDGLVVAGGGFMVIWYTYINPALSLRDTALPTLLSMTVYPPLDLVLVLGICVVLVRGTRTSSPRVLTLLLVAAIAYLASDLYGSYQSVHITGWQTNSLLYLTSMLPLMMIASAAVEQSHPTDPDAVMNPPDLSRHTILLPNLALLIGFGMLLFATIGARSTALTGLVFGALTMVCGVLARQLYALRENETLLATDNLTGLPNRTQLSRALRRALNGNRLETGGSAVLLIDLNGFKQVNDTYGHDAGDQLLVAFGRVLRQQTRSSDTPARLGGDEFAVVLNNLSSPANAVAVAEKIVYAAGQERPLARLPVTIRASIGIAFATLPRGKHRATPYLYSDAEIRTLLLAAGAKKYKGSRRDPSRRQLR